MSELITCPTCGAKVSSSAHYCVECGEPDPWENCEEREEQIKRKKQAAKKAKEDQRIFFNEYRKHWGDEKALEWATEEKLIELKSIKAHEVKIGDTIKSPYGGYSLFKITEVCRIYDGTLEFTGTTTSYPRGVHLSKILPNQAIILYIDKSLNLL